MTDVATRPRRGGAVLSLLPGTAQFFRRSLAVKIGLAAIIAQMELYSCALPTEALQLQSRMRQAEGIYMQPSEGTALANLKLPPEIETAVPSHAVAQDYPAPACNTKLDSASPRNGGTGKWCVADGLEKQLRWGSSNVDVPRWPATDKHSDAGWQRRDIELPVSNEKGDHYSVTKHKCWVRTDRDGNLWWHRQDDITDESLWERYPPVFERVASSHEKFAPTAPGPPPGAIPVSAVKEGTCVRVRSDLVVCSEGDAVFSSSMREGDAVSMRKKLLEALPPYMPGIVVSTPNGRTIKPFLFAATAERVKAATAEGVKKADVSQRRRPWKDFFRNANISSGSGGTADAFVAPLLPCPGRTCDICCEERAEAETKRPCWRCVNKTICKPCLQRWEGEAPEQESGPKAGQRLFTCPFCRCLLR